MDVKLMAFDVVTALTQTLTANTTFTFDDVVDEDLLIFYGSWWDGDQWWAQPLPTLENCTTTLISNFNDDCIVVRIVDVTGAVAFTPVSGEYAFFTLALYRDTSQVTLEFDQSGYNPMGPVWFEPASLTEYLAVLVHGGSSDPSVTGPPGLEQLTHGSHTDGAYTVDLSIWQYPVAGSPVHEVNVSGVGYLMLLSQPYPVLPADPNNPAPVGSGQFPIN